ncbi:hypothetical protein STAS_03658 [Striga asiatica]|uniref:Uncharacterized protein n=1 Tax=Striga asiatica TaxID=4170 RepID=A0A5A7P569_STRAF|nr:hypothetical protein STAS_03658 [Striga asiatica]
MDGLIPMVLKSIKKRKTRSKYQCLSAPPITHTYNIEDFYMSQNVGQGPDRISGFRGAHYRRYNSAHVGGRSGEDDKSAADSKPKKLVRFRSHRLFSCVGGA